MNEQLDRMEQLLLRIDKRLKKIEKAIIPIHYEQWISAEEAMRITGLQRRKINCNE
jgi:hypothetical protein